MNMDENKQIPRTLVKDPPGKIVGIEMSRSLGGAETLLALTEFGSIYQWDPEHAGWLVIYVRKHTTL